MKINYEGRYYGNKSYGIMQFGLGVMSKETKKRYERKAKEYAKENRSNYYGKLCSWCHKKVEGTRFCSEHCRIKRSESDKRVRDKFKERQGE